MESTNSIPQPRKASSNTISRAMEGDRQAQTPLKVPFNDVVVKVMNTFPLLFSPREGAFYIWSNSGRDFTSFLGEFSRGQHTDIYGSRPWTYKYHPQQRFRNAIRKFDVTDSLGVQMKQTGNAAFYRVLHGQNNVHFETDYDVDMTRIEDLSTVKSSADYVYREVCARKGEESGMAARESYVRGYSRVVDAMDLQDWKKLRSELRNGEHLGSGREESSEKNVLLVAISYKGKSVKITRRMNMLKEDGTPEDDDGLLAQSEIQMTSDFVDDFRWSQMIRSCVAVCKQRGTNKIRLWIDRLVMMMLSKDERAKVYDVVEWEDFGLFAYAVCPVIRLYDRQERHYGTDFWRKLEAVLGVAGRGIVVDDYILREYDSTIYFGASMYRRFADGISSIGGRGYYLRSVTLALATAVMTDGVTVSAANEDLRTVRAASAWKAWALRTIAEGAYSRTHASMLTREEAFTVSLREFMTIAFWESLVSRCAVLTGNSYLDMSYQKSMSWGIQSNWDGVIEWIGMFHSSCVVKERDEIMSFLNANAEMSMWTSTTGHVASIITLRTADQQHKRGIVVDLSRFSTVRRGHVVAVAEATGLWGGNILARHLRFKVNPELGQEAKIGENGMRIEYHAMEVEFSCMPKGLGGAKATVVALVLLPVWLLLLIRFGAALLLLAVLPLAGVAYMLSKPWPWYDTCNVGEAVFDNLLLHSLYKSGIKKQYRRLKGRYEEIGWHEVGELT